MYNMLLFHYIGRYLQYYCITKIHVIYITLFCRYLREPDALGTAGGLYYFRDTILAPLNDSNGIQGEQIQAFFVMNGDVCADFPLDEMLDMHFNSRRHQSLHQQNQPVLITVMATETTRQQSVQYGVYILDMILTYL